MSYMEKKTTKRKTTIITLSDHNKEEIRNIDFQKQNMEEEFNQKKIGVYCIFSMGVVNWIGWRDLQNDVFLLSLGAEKHYICISGNF